MILIRMVVLVSGVVLADTISGASQSRTERLRWMSGCWQQRDGRSIVQEFWTSPQGGMLFGIGRTIAARQGGDTTVSFEMMRIYERDGRVVFAAQPSSQGQTEFTEHTLTDSTVVFANPSHDFPQFVRYRRRGTNELSARVDGKMEGKEMGFDSNYRRVACPR